MALHRFGRQIVFIKMPPHGKTDTLSLQMCNLGKLRPLSLCWRKENTHISKYIHGYTIPKVYYDFLFTHICLKFLSQHIWLHLCTYTARFGGFPSKPLYDAIFPLVVILTSRQFTEWHDGWIWSNTESWVGPSWQKDSEIMHHSSYM